MRSLLFTALGNTTETCLSQHPDNISHRYLPGLARWLLFVIGKCATRSLLVGAVSVQVTAFSKSMILTIPLQS